MVRPDVLELFADRLASAGFNATAFVPSYGMAEATLGITFSDLDTPYRVDVIDRAQTKGSTVKPMARRSGATSSRALQIVGVS